MSFLSDYCKVYENALPTSLCDYLVTQFEASSKVKEGREETEGENPILVRSRLELALPELDDFATQLQPVLMKITELAVGKYQSELPVRTFPRDIAVETFMLHKYRAETKDYFAYHVDVNSYSSAKRYLALCWFLSDTEKGGETFFPHPNIRVKPKKGRLLMFPSLWLYPHSEEPSVSVDTYKLCTYLHWV